MIKVVKHKIVTPRKRSRVAFGAHIITRNGCAQHNFDDLFFLGLDVCAFLRESTVNHGTICNILQGLWKIKIDFQKVFTAYAHFEALSDRT